MSSNSDGVKTSGISFKLSSSSKSKQKPSESVIADRETAGGQESDQRDYLLSVEGNTLHSVIPTPAAKELIIPLIKKNKWRLPVKENKSSANAEEKQVNEEDQEAVAAILEDVQSGKLSAVSMEVEDGSSGPVIPLLMQNKPPVDPATADGKLNDLELRPSESTMDDYSDMPIGQFGAAMLKGMGWKPGEAIGLNKKGLLEPIEYIAHPGGLGLGATMRPPEQPKGKEKRKIKKPGEVEKKRAVPYKDKDGRVKHIKKIGEEIPEHIPEGFFPGNYGEVTIGPHAGLQGKIISVDKDRSRVTLRMAINKQDMTFDQQDIKLISKEEAIGAPPTGSVPSLTPQEALGSSISQHKQYGLILLGSKKSHNSEHGGQSPGNQSSSRSRESKDRGRRSEEKPRIKDEDVRSRNDSKVVDLKPVKLEPREGRGQESSGRKRKRVEDGRTVGDETAIKQEFRADEIGTEECIDTRTKIKKETNSADIDHYYSLDGTTSDGHYNQSSKSSSNGGRENNKYKKPHKELHVLEEKGQGFCWLRSQLRVRIIDQKYKNGRHYNRKVVIVDIVDPTTCICQTDDGKLLEGVRLDMLETMVPKEPESVVMILKGSAKGQLASMVHRNTSKCMATVQLMHSKEVMEIEYDNICEYTGETYL